MFSHRQSEINERALLALHTTSLSFKDFKACSLLDLPVPKRNLNKRSMDRFSQVTSKICGISMDLAAAEVRGRVDSEPAVIDGATRCHVSYDASWHRRGHYSNQGFWDAIDSTSGKILDFEVLQRVCKKCSNWPDERQHRFLKNTTCSRRNTLTVPSILLEPAMRWRVQSLLNYGNDLSRVID